MFEGAHEMRVQVAALDRIQLRLKVTVDLLKLLAVEVAYAPPAWLQLAIWLPLTLFSALALLQPTKGAIVGLQWQTGMHGFEDAKRRREAGGTTLAVQTVSARR